MPHTLWKVLTSGYKLETPYLKVRLDICETVRKNEADYYVIERADAVGIVAFDVERNIILERQYRHPIRSWIIELPAGLTEEGENPQSAIQRELAEETGYTVESPILLYKFYPLPGLVQQKFTLYIGFNAKKSGEPKRDSSEDIEIMTVPFEQALQMIQEREIEDIETIGALFLAKKYIKTNGYLS